MAAGEDHHGGLPGGDEPINAGRGWKRQGRNDNGYPRPYVLPVSSRLRGNQGRFPRARRG
ncbi:hypothetical protein ABGB16_15825 [Micromonospora sp. B11E3]|uniref:hypothetical protein n=1 Tax=Micromonospora sp. B11E3 TaxID=3153562 RepID=UPI00325E8898